GREDEVAARPCDQMCAMCVPGGRMARIRSHGLCTRSAPGGSVAAGPVVPAALRGWVTAVRHSVHRAVTTTTRCRGRTRPLRECGRAYETPINRGQGRMKRPPLTSRPTPGM